jgi:hypothetical protein
MLRARSPRVIREEASHPRGADAASTCSGAQTKTSACLQCETTEQMEFPGESAVRSLGFFARSANPMIFARVVEVSDAMDPIDIRADTTFNQALRCVQYRLPRAEGFRAPGYVLAFGIRYGMIGMSASHHLLLTAEDFEEGRMLSMIDSWPNLVEDHVRWDMAPRLPFPVNSNLPRLIGRISSLPMNAYLPLYRRLCPLSRALEFVGETMFTENRSMVVEGWPWFKRRNAVRLFRATLRDSMSFAGHFFDRRQADLDELPEIALIGE